MPIDRYSGEKVNKLDFDCIAPLLSQPPHRRNDRMLIGDENLRKLVVRFAEALLPPYAEGEFSHLYTMDIYALVPSCSLTCLLA